MQTADEFHQRTLATARRPDDGDELALPDGDVECIDNLRSIAAAAVMHRDAIEAHECLRAAVDHFPHARVKRLEFPFVTY